jgi:hypothetical protein
MGLLKPALSLPRQLSGFLCGHQPLNRLWAVFGPIKNGQNRDVEAHQHPEEGSPTSSKP